MTDTQDDFQEKSIVPIGQQYFAILAILKL